jgi:hypothetical protein
MLLAADAFPAVDPVARGIAVAAVILVGLSIALTYFLWYRSGSHLKATAFVMAETSTIHIEVANTGRLVATVKNLELRDHLVLRVNPGLGETRTSPTHRWTLIALPNGGPLPREVPPTGFIDCDVEIKKILEEARNLSETAVSAWAPARRRQMVFVAARSDSLVNTFVTRRA